MQNFPNKCVIVLIAAKDVHNLKDAHKKTYRVQAHEV